MPRATKRVTLTLLTVTLLSLVLLSTSLSNLQFKAGAPFPIADSHNTMQSSAVPQNPSSTSPILQMIFTATLLLLMIYVSVRLILLLKLKWLFRLIQILAILLAIILILSLIKFEATYEVSEIGITRSLTDETSPLGKPPQGFVYLVVIGFVLLGGFLLTRVFIRPTHHVDPLLKEVEIAMQSITAGKDFKNVIVRCYMSMADALKEEYGLERGKHLTPREFEDLLVFKGLPSAPIHNLTNLFEKVRYGRQPLNTTDEKLAIEGLSAIINFIKAASHG